MPVPPPTPETRWRCSACGNLTRFDVVRTRRLREYVHADLAGEPVVEESETLSDVVEHVTCRWCGAVDQVELVPRPDTTSATPAPESAPPASSQAAPTAPPASSQAAPTATAAPPGNAAPPAPAPPENARTAASALPPPADPAADPAAADRAP